MKLWQKQVLIYASIFVFLLLVLLIFPSVDYALTLSLQNIKSNFMDSSMKWVTSIGSGIVVFFVMSALFLYEERKRRWILPLWLGFALASVLVFLLKIIMLRERPFEVFGLPALSAFSVWNSSFPSWHAAMAFSALPVLDKEFSKIKIFWIIFALLIVISRVYLLYHFVSDVITGALIGYFSGFLFMKIWEKRVKGMDKNKIKTQSRKK